MTARQATVAIWLASTPALIGGGIYFGGAVGMAMIELGIIDGVAFVILVSRIFFSKR